MIWHIPTWLMYFDVKNTATLTHSEFLICSVYDQQLISAERKQNFLVSVNQAVAACGYIGGHILCSQPLFTAAVTYTCTPTGTQTALISQLTDTPQALLVKAPDEVSTQVTPRGLSVAAGMEVVPFACFLFELEVLAAA